MNTSTDPTPRRILVIDDNRAIHEDFRKILSRAEAGTGALDQARAQFFGEAAPAPKGSGFEVDSAFQGLEGVEALRRSLDEGRPYALAFVDVRMPPGLDGVETASLLWAASPDLQIVLCTAYSDYSWQTTVTKLGHSDRLLILKKPFDTVEVLQMAHALTEKWALSQALTVRLADLESLVGERTRQLTEANAQLREQAALLDKARDAIIVQDLEGKISYWNPSAERLYGWSAAEASGRNAGALLSLDEVAHREARAAALERGDWVGELRQRNKEGREVIVESRWTLVRNELGQPASLLAINTDVTEKKKLEAQFLRAQRMESIGVLAGGIAHDLNNVLGPILMSLEILRKRFPDSESDELLSVLQTTAERGSGMVRRVLQFARGAEGERMLVQPAHLIRELQRVTADTFPKNIQVRTPIAPGLWLVSADPTQVHQILLNLSVNACDAMPEGGILTLAAENVTIDATYASMIFGGKPGQYVRLQVTDTGTGMPPEVVDRIFEPFYTTKEPGHGTGLGLSTTLTLVEAHGGFIEVLSECSKGTTFRVYLPAVLEGAAATPAAGVELPRGEGELVLLVDDEPAQRLILRRTLEEFGYRVLLASDGAEACALYARQQHEVALVLTDLMMPIMDGATTIRALKCMNPGLPIIAMTGVNAAGRLELAREAGASTILVKPYRTEALLVALRDTLAAPVTPLAELAIA